jgi:hypothetical protein
MIRLAFWLAVIYFVVGLFHPELATVDLTASSNVEPQVVASTVAQNRPDGCNIDIGSKLATEHEVGSITNLKEDRFEFGARNECTVNYDIVIDGEQHHVDQTETSLEQMNSVCYYARERGRKDLLLSLGGKFNSHANIDCRYRDTIGKTER